MMRKIERSCRHHAEQDPAACEALLDILIEKFTGLGLLNDRNFAEAQVRTLRRRGASARSIRSRLAAKGIGAGDMENLMAAGGDLPAALRLAQRKRIGPFGRKEKENREKDMAALARAGYDYETARRALALTREDAEQIIADSGCRP